MPYKNRFSDHIKGVFNYVVLLISMAGFVAKHATVSRILAIGTSVAFSIYLTIYHSGNSILGLVYFAVSEVLYVGFIFLVLSAKGWRLWFIGKREDEEKGYLEFEAILGFLFFHNAASLGFIASSSPGNLAGFMSGGMIAVMAGLMALTGLIVKIWSTKVVSIEIYYWKDMFLGKKICEFVVTGPYKFLSNPMYGIGQLQAYAVALWYGSPAGLAAAFINQALIFTFYFTVEKKFIRRVYRGGA